MIRYLRKKKTKLVELKGTMQTLSFAFLVIWFVLRKKLHVEVLKQATVHSTT